MGGQLRLAVDKIGEMRFKGPSGKRRVKARERGRYQSGFLFLKHAHRRAEMNEHMRAGRLRADKQHGNALSAAGAFA